jgi:hypothetical protein
LNAEASQPTHPVVVAEFRDPADARQAMLDLEGIGVDAQAINLVERSSAVPAQNIEQSGELSAAGDTARRYVGGGLIGAAVGAVIGVLLGLLANTDPATIGIVGGVMCGGIVGFVLGGYWGGASKLAVNPDALDTYTMDRSDSEPVHLEVQAHSDDQARQTVDVLRKAKADSVDLRS